MLDDALLPPIFYVSKFKSRCSFTDFKTLRGLTATVWPWHMLLDVYTYGF